MNEVVASSHFNI